MTYVTGSWRDLSTAEFFGNVKASTATIAADPDFNLEIHGNVPMAANSKRPQFNPLPGTEAEAADVAKDLSVPPDHVLMGDAARKGIVESVQSPAVLHLATHSIPNLGWQAPAAQYAMFEFPLPTDTQLPLLQSVIAFAGANKPQRGSEDGLLTGLEVGSLHLPGTRLVVLSSCQSAQGSVVDGQGVLGFRAAFAMAGAQAIVMTLWPVDDLAGKQFMDFFYSHIGEGASEAVRLAQKDMLATENYKNPFFWSGYVVSESPDRQDRGAQSVASAARPVGGRSAASASVTPGSRTAAGAPTSGTAAAAASGAPASATAFGAGANSVGPVDALVTPNCFEFHSKSKPDGSYVYATDIRVKIGGAVKRSQPTPNEVDLDLTPPGNGNWTCTTSLFFRISLR